MSVYLTTLQYSRHPRDALMAAFIIQLFTLLFTTNSHHNISLFLFIRFRYIVARLFKLLSAPAAPSAPSPSAERPQPGVVLLLSVVGLLLSGRGTVFPLGRSPRTHWSHRTPGTLAVTL